MKKYKEEAEDIRNTLKRERKMERVKREEEKRMKKKVITEKKRELFLFFERILAVVLAVSVTFVFINSFFNISTSYGITYHYAVSPLEQEQAFEDKEIFQSLVLGNMEQITRYVVICHQLETNGRYDEDKKIEISKYANRNKDVSQYQPRAEYYLDDLVTWGNYGFTYKTLVGSREELNALFLTNQLQGIWNGILSLGEYNEKSSIKEYAGSIQDNAALIQQEAADGDKLAMELLVPRYLTVDGKDLMQCAANIEEYEILKKNLVDSAKSLFENYTEYVALEQQYNKENTNIGYCFQVKSENGLQYYSNSDLIFKGKTADDITAMIKEQGGKFIYFNPDKVQINTNTEISAKQMRNMLKAYEYTFGDDTRVWVWIDTEYPANDSLQMVRNELKAFRPYFISLSVCAVSALVLGFLVILYLIYKEGRILENDGTLNYTILKQDKILFEIWAFLAIGMEVVLAKILGQLLNGFRNGTVSYAMLPVTIGIIVFVMNEIGIRFCFSVIRRIKAKKVWETTLVYAVLKGIRNFVIKTIANGSLVSRIWIPYLIFLIVNLILVLLGVGGVIGALLLDILVGIYLYRESKQREEIVTGIEIIKNGDSKHRIDTTYLYGENLKLAESVNSIGVGIRKAVETSMKDEKLKTDLITNVSHDIKTPLTSIITYVDLLKRENIEDKKIQGYIDVLEGKSQRLKQLIDDLVEASKISSGNISIQLDTINFVELVRQSIGEFDEKFAAANLQIVTKLPDSPMFIEADSGQLWRVMENLFQNVSKYAMHGTRVYIEMEADGDGFDKKNVFSVKNISARYLEVEAEDLTERFIRGDKSRQTEGSGLGLSIAKNLIEAQGGEFDIMVDGDLFKAIIKFPAIEKK